jgi:hypothetical protein
MKHMFLALMLGVATTPAWAQTPPTAAPTAPSPPVAPGSPAVPPEKIVPPTGSGATGRTMSDQLSKDRGTVTPPSNVDPSMAVHPGTHGSTMPVIPPPGSPGGNPAVVPK